MADSINPSVKGESTQLRYWVSPLFWMLFSSIILTILLWLPFGFNMGGLIEEWGIQRTFDHYGAFFFCDAKGPMPAMQMRPLLILPYALAYLGDPNSFFFYHIILMVGICLKCFAFSVIIWVLTKSRRLALFSGMLLVLYPADTMQISFRILHVNLSLSLMLLGTACLLYALELPGTIAKGLLTAVAAALVVVSVLMYEAAAVLLPLPFIIQFIRLGFSPTWRLIWDQKWVALGWLFSFAACVTYEIYVTTHHATYENALCDPTQDILAHIPLIFSIGFVRSLTGGWFDAFGILTSEFHNYSYLILMVVALLGLIYFGRSRQLAAQAKPETLAWSLVARLIGGGLLLVFLGYLPTLPAYSHLIITQRTYLFSSPGGCLVWLGVILALLKISRSLAVVLGAILLLAGSAAQLFQFDHYNRLWNVQKNIMRSIVESLPSIPSGQTLLIIDASGQMNYDPWIFGNDVDSAVSYIYHQPIHTEVCLQPGNYWQALDSYGRPGQCVETPDSWKFFHLPPFDKSGMAQTSTQVLAYEISKKDVQVIKIETDGSTAHAQSKEHVVSLMNGDTFRISRYLNILASAPWMLDFGLFSSPAQPTQYRWDFGRWWNLDLPIRGTGWRQREWTVNYYHHTSYSWKNEPVATHLFKIYPEKKPYLIEGKFVCFSPNTKRDDIKFQMNGHDIPLVWTDSTTFNGELSLTQMQNGMNEIEFAAPDDAKCYGLSVALDWVSVHPK